jgi:hypothetical protein
MPREAFANAAARRELRDAKLLRKAARRALKRDRKINPRSTPDERTD